VRVVYCVDIDIDIDKVEDFADREKGNANADRTKSAVSNCVAMMAVAIYLLGFSVAMLSLLCGLWFDVVIGF